MLEGAAATGLAMFAAPEASAVKLGDIGACPAEKRPSRATNPRAANHRSDNGKASRPDRVMRVCSWPWQLGKVERETHSSLNAGEQGRSLGEWKVPFRLGS